MYNDYFGFSESPFNITPNPRFYFRTHSCDEVLAVVRDGIETRKGLIVVVGEPGSGKTLFLKSLIRDLTPKAKTVIVPNPRADLNEMLRLLVEKLNLEGPLDDRTARLNRLTDHLIEQRQQGRLVCLLIDEAQDLDTHTLDELRLLANLEFEGDALLPVVLVGQLELNLKLDHPSAIRIKQRVALTRSLYPLIRSEVGPYINCRLKVAGYDRNGLFDPEAINAIAAHSGGIPRMVNAICDNSLLRAYTTNQRVISAQLVDQVARELRINAPVSLQKQTTGVAFQHGQQEQRKSLSHQAERLPALFELDHREPGAFYEVSDSHVLGPANELNELAAKMPQTSRPVAGLGVRRGVLFAPMRWYAAISAVALLLLALSTVNFSQLAGMHSLVARKAATPATESPAPITNSQTADDVTAPRDTSPASTPDGSEAEVAPVEPAISAPGTETNTEKAVNGANPPSGQPAQPAVPAQAQPADPFTSKKNETKPAVVTLEVVALSKVRAQPNDQSEIIAELEPGNRVTVLAKSRDYYHVRSVDNKSIRGYVHREDAFFESTTRRQ